jgi:hypothetical protein
MESAQPEKNKVSIRIPLLVSGAAQSSAGKIDGTMVEIEAPDGMRWNSGWLRSSDVLLTERPSINVFFSVDSTFFEQVKSTSTRVHISFALAEFPAKETRRITAAAGEFAVPGGALCAIVRDGYGAIECRSPLTRPFLLVSTIAGETTCPPREDLKAAPPGTVFSGVIWNPAAARAELGISPVTVSSIDLRLWSRTQEDLPPRLCPGTPLTFSILDGERRTRGELNIDGLRLGDYELHRISSRGD